MNSNAKYSSVILFTLFCLLDCFLWFELISGIPINNAHIYFLDVGQGDAELLVLPGNIKIMTDAGPTNKVLSSLDSVLSKQDRYIDLAIISHPQLDHFNGYNFMLDHYTFGAFISNGRSDTKGVVEWPALIDKIKSKNIPLITLGGGDSLHYKDTNISFLSPNNQYIQSGELNDTGLIEHIVSPAFSALFTADIDARLEDFLVAHTPITADILKVPHHGSRYSSSMNFLRAVSPKIAVIEVAKKNSYGHPAQETLARLASSGISYIFRTDKDGTIDIVSENNKLKVYHR